MIRQPHTLSPLLDGGGQEFGLRSGTENLPAIAGLSLAAELSAARLDSESLRLAQLMQQLQSGLKALCPQLQIAGEQAVRSPGILCCAFPGISGEEMAIRLSRQDICVSPGAARSARNSKPSHVLLSMGYSPKEAAGFLRFSLGAGTTEEEIRQTIHSIAHIIS